VYLVIEPNDVIPPHSGLTIRQETNSLFVGGRTNPDGSCTSAPFEGEVGDVVRVTADSADGVLWEVCVLISNFGRQPDPCE
jgi:hypothetical protein